MSDWRFILISMLGGVVLALFLISVVLLSVIRSERKKW